MSSHRNVLTVFIASPGDVGKERAAAYEVVEEVNECVRELGWAVDLRGWEDTLPGHGRPQAIINEDVHACDLFLGLLYARWGTPTGEHSSGFGEEYALAHKLREQHGSPEICLYFKKPPAAQMKDPGPQLKQVLDFRRLVEVQRKVLFKEVRSEAEWRRAVRTLFFTHIMRRRENFRSHAGAGLGAGPGAALVVAEEGNDTESVGADVGIVCAIESAQSHLTEPGELTPAEAVRLALYAQAALFRRTASPLGVHEANLLYRFREVVEPNGTERLLLAATVAGSDLDTVPGWYWFRDASERGVRGVLFHTATRGDDRARVRAAELLALARVPLGTQPDDRTELLAGLLGDGDADALAAKLDYVAAVADPADLTELERATAADSRPQVRVKLTEARARVAARAAPDPVMLQVIRGEVSYTDGLGEVFREHQGRIETATLQDAVRHPNDAVRRLAVSLLDRRGGVTADLARHLVKHGSGEERALGHRKLVEAGAVDVNDLPPEVANLPAVGGAAAALLAAQPAAALKAQVDLFGSQHVYAALAFHHFQDFADQLRADLADGFEQMWRSAETQLKSAGPMPDEINRRLRLDGDVGRFITGRYTAIAVGALTRHGSKSDLPTVRKLLTAEQDNVLDEVVRFLARHGDATDFESLLDLAQCRTFARDKVAATAAALAVSGRSAEAIKAILAVDEATVVRVAVAAITPADAAEYEGELVALLFNPSAALRTVAVAGVCAVFGHEKLEAILTAALDRPTYYYNVVCWLDRHLYAPPPLRAVFHGQLTRVLEVEEDESGSQFAE